MKKIIEAKNLSYSYGRGTKAVDSISFDVEEGEILGFLGPNGAGKSTTIKILTGFLRPQSGAAVILGHNVSKQADLAQRKMGVCFEEKNLYDEMTARENLTFFASLFGIRNPPIDELLEKVDLPDKGKERVRAFSKGMKQRLMIARALINEPKVLFLDEPTDGLDPVSAKSIRSVILEEKSKGASVLLTTHDMLEADKLSDRVAFINEGRIEALETPDQLKHEHGQRTLTVRYKADAKLVTEELPLEQKQTGKKLAKLFEKHQVYDLHSKEATLEDVFIRVTGRDLG